MYDLNVGINRTHLKAGSGRLLNSMAGFYDGLGIMVLMAVL